MYNSIIISDIMRKGDNRMPTNANTKLPGKIIMAIGCLIALFIPLYIAIAYYNVAKDAPPTISNVTQLIITDKDGTKYDLKNADGDEANDIKWFIGINGRAKKQESISKEQLAKMTLFKAEYRIFDRSQTYKYYFCDNIEQAYYVDDDGTAYRITEEDAVNFLNSRYARCMYETSEFPIMTVSGKTVLPANAKWTYRTYGGGENEVEDITKGDMSDELFKMNGKFALSFNKEPETVDVIIISEGKQLYNGPYSDVGNVSIEGKTVDVTVSAQWYQTAEDPCEGSASYHFKAKVLLPAKFYLGTTVVDPGQFVSISAKNIEDPAEITFKSEPDIGYTPTFFLDGEYARALVPISYDAIDTKSGAVTIKFTCGYGETTQDMYLDVNKYSFGSSTLNVGTATTSATRNTRTITAFETAMAPVIAQTASKPLWKDNFEFPLEGGQIRIGFGRYVTIANTTTTYRHQGMDLLPSGSKSARSMMDGVVAYTGYFDYTGYIVVVDHGLGLKSWYAHLSEPNGELKVGDKVAAGDILGTVGKFGFTETTKLHAGLSVYDVPVSPYQILYENDDTGEIPGIPITY